MLLRVIDEGKKRDIHIDEGEMFLLPGSLAHIPPVRFRDATISDDAF